MPAWLEGSELPAELPPDAEVWIACASGYRASIAAGLLERAGRHPVVLTPGGVPDVRDHLAAATATRTAA